MNGDSDDRDDRFNVDFGRLFPSEYRNRKRRTASPRKLKAPEKRDGFVSRMATEDRRKKSKPSQRDLGKRYDDDHPTPLMGPLIKEMVAEDLDRKPDDIMAELEDLGYEAAPVTVCTIRDDILKVIRLCHQARQRRSARVGRLGGVCS